ncbi:hypothetical protein MCEMIH16_02977 [Caulobacteraceae bacterium]
MVVMVASNVDTTSSHVRAKCTRDARDMVNRDLTNLRQGELMPRLVALLVLSLALAAPAAAQQGRIAVGQTSGDQAGLRGSVSATPAPAPEEDPLLLAPPPAQPLATSGSPAGGSQCRLSCSQTYYFCLAGEDERCPQLWSRCVAGCAG